MKKMISILVLLMAVSLIVIGCTKAVDKTVQGQTGETGISADSTAVVQEDTEISDNLNDLNDLDTITTDVEADVNVDDLDELVN
ncbi:hypothetical protein HYX11_05295 [Candidatus Woesearchaeota archaeon]|nr:hypothetical protein [Candidatus Woesearchaeota archaeon]